MLAAEIIGSKFAVTPVFNVNCGDASGFKSSRLKM